MKPQLALFLIVTCPLAAQSPALQQTQSAQVRALGDWATNLKLASITLRTQRVLGTISDAQRASQMAALSAAWMQRPASAEERSQWSQAFEMAANALFSQLSRSVEGTPNLNLALETLASARWELGFQRGAEGDLARPLAQAISILDISRPQPVYAAAYQGVDEEVESLMTAQIQAIRFTAPGVPQQALSVPSSLGQPAVPSQTESLGRIWRVREGSFTGIWTRRSGTNSFDGVWSSGTTAVLVMSLTGAQVRVDRRDPNGAVCIYTGRLSGSSATGSVACGASAEGGFWSAEVEGAAAPRPVVPMQPGPPPVVSQPALPPVSAQPVPLPATPQPQPIVISGPPVVPSAPSGAAVTRPSDAIYIAPGSSFAFLGADDTTLGNWGSRYGRSGAMIITDTESVPFRGATVIPREKFDYSWGTSSDLRGLVRIGAPDRYAGAWYAPSVFEVEVAYSGTSPARLTAYFVDWDNTGREARIEVVDPGTNRILDTQNLARFSGGRYLSWRIVSRVVLRLTRTGGPNVVLNALFLDPDGPLAMPGSSVSFLGTDTATQGNWRGRFGKDAALIPGEPTGPSAFRFTPGQKYDYSWGATLTDPRGPSKFSGAERSGSVWYAPSSFDIDVQPPAGVASYRMAAYFVDWDTNGRAQRLEIVDPVTNAVLDTRSIVNFQSGIYVSWRLRGRVILRITRTAGSNALVNALYADIESGAPDPGPTAVPAGGPGAAAFQGEDRLTGGNWRGRYGAGGGVIAGDTAFPSAVTFTPRSKADYLWAPTTQSPQALNRANGADRIAFCWYSNSFFEVEINVPAGQSYKLSAYFLDWDNLGRSQRVDLMDAATGAVLDSRVASQFSGGVYFSWRVSGRAVLKLTTVAGVNAVLSGLFVDPI